MKSSQKAHFSVPAFTLLELLLSLAIIILLMAILFANYPSTATRLTLVNVSHKVSLLVREAQVRGSAIDSLNSTLGGYGIYASLAATNRIILFGDTIDSTVVKPNGLTVGNGSYETTSPDETKTITTFPRGFYIKKLCVGNGFPFTCNTSNSPAIQSLTVSFIRPNPAPNIYINNTTSSRFNGACIELRDPRSPEAGHIRNVQVYNSGMIYISVGKCDNDPS